MDDINYEALKNNVTDVIKESQIKIGYTPNSVSLNYPVDSLNRFLGTDCSTEEMKTVLQGFCRYVRNELGEIRLSIVEEKFCLTIPAEGAAYVHEKIKDSGFLTDFIALISSGGSLTIDKILQVFYKYSENVFCKEVDDEEFNYLVYFKDGKPDDFRYCIDIDLGHVAYHRLTPADYDAMGYDY